MSKEFTVELLSTKMPWPLSFARHYWFVCDDGEKAVRVEVWAPIFITGATTVVYDALPLRQGFRTSFFDSVTNPKRTGIVFSHGVSQGGATSPAEQLYTVLLQAGANTRTLIAIAYGQDQTVIRL